MLVLEDAVHPSDGLHQVVPFHGLIDVESVYARCIEARQPHIPHDHQLERIFGILEAFLQAFLHLAGIDMRAQQGLV
ncbi:hypothetical protein D3C78_1067750 [compost metagenome]